MDTRYLHTFRQVARSQSFTRAAESLGYAQSSVTTQIQNIEQEFGVTLFERWGRKIRLTHSGELLLGYAQQVLDLMDQAHENLSQESQIAGTLTIGTVESLAAFFLPPKLQSFRREHPRTKLQLQPGVCSDLRQGVRDGVYDFAVILDRLQTHADLECINLGEEEVAVIAAPDHRLAKRDLVKTSDFTGESWIFTENGCSYRTMIENVLQRSDVPIETSLEFGSLEAIKQCVAYGLGLALLPLIAVKEDVEKGKVSILPYSHPDIRVYRQLIYHKKKWLPQAVHHFFELLQEKNDIQSETSV